MPMLGELLYKISKHWKQLLVLLIIVVSFIILFLPSREYRVLLSSTPRFAQVALGECGGTVYGVYSIPGGKTYVFELSRGFFDVQRLRMYFGEKPVPRVVLPRDLRYLGLVCWKDHPLLFYQDSTDYWYRLRAYDLSTGEEYTVDDAGVGTGRDEYPLVWNGEIHVFYFVDEGKQLKEAYGPGFPLKTRQIGSGIGRYISAKLCGGKIYLLAGRYPDYRAFLLPVDGNPIDMNVSIGGRGEVLCDEGITAFFLSPEQRSVVMYKDGKLTPILPGEVASPVRVLSTGGEYLLAYHRYMKGLYFCKSKNLVDWKCEHLDSDTFAGRRLDAVLWLGTPVILYSTTSAVKLYYVVSPPRILLLSAIYLMAILAVLVAMIPRILRNCHRRKK